MNMSERIQNIRKSKGISQEELANKIGVSRQAVSKWESGQSIPDLDKIIIMSEYFNVTTDHILKGIENVQQTNKNNKDHITSQILYVASTAFIVIGLLCAFGGWYEEQSAESIWGSMIIQVVGVVGYFISKIIYPSKVSFTIKWLNIIIILFMPISLLVTFILNGVLAPYPTDVLSGFVFALVYITTMIVSYFILKKNKINMT